MCVKRKCQEHSQIGLIEPSRALLPCGEHARQPSAIRTWASTGCSIPLSASERVDLVTRPGANAALSDETRISPTAAWRFKPGSHIDGATNRGEIAADGREFAYLNLTAVDADANTELIRRHTKTRGQGSERRIAASLNVESRRDRHLSMLLDLNRKVEDCHQAIAHLLVHDGIVRQMA